MFVTQWYVGLFKGYEWLSIVMIVLFIVSYYYNDHMASKIGKIVIGKQKCDDSDNSIE